MTLARANFDFARRRAFTLIELIGVLAIMSILAAAVAPNVIRSLDRATVRAEADNLHNFGDLLKNYICDTNSVPTATTWTTALAPYASANAVDLLYNRRQANGGAAAVPRRFAVDPIAANQRAMFISSMRTGVALPDDATISANFTAIWNWDSTNVDVANTPPTGLAAWVPTLREFLVIERVNLKSIPLIQFELRNQSTTKAPIYRIYNAAGTIIQSGTVPVHFGTTDGTLSPNCRSNQRISLYDASNNLNYSFVVSTQPKNFIFDGTSWTAQ